MSKTHRLVVPGLPVVAIFTLMAGFVMLRGGTDLRPEAATQGALGGAQSSPVRVAVDLTKPAPDPTQSLSAACRYPFAGAAAQPSWSAWVGEGAAAWTVSSSESAVPAGAAAIPAGGVIAITNGADATRSIHLEVRAGRGVYTVERLSFTMLPAVGSVRLERLPSTVLGVPGSFVRSISLDAHSGVALRVVNRNQEVASAFARVRTELRAVRAADPGFAQRISVPLIECGSQIAYLSSGVSAAGRNAALQHIHRALLTIAHAEALAKNARRGGNASTNGGEAFQTALNELGNALSELSGACLNLVPGINVSDTNGGNPLERTVVVSLENRGSRAVTGVRIGVEVPAACRVSPSDQAIFSTVGPGQSVRATFRVVLADGVKADTVRGQVSYFAEHSPATLRVGTCLPAIR